MDQTPYDGSDPNLKQENIICIHCSEKSPTHQCTRCGLAWYCSKECQEKNRSNHNELCMEIRELKQDVEREAEPLRTFNKFFAEGEEPENLFEEQAGHFWNLVETRDYISSRFDLAKAIYTFAYHQETTEAWEITLGHNLEILRLCSSDNLGVRFKVPFLLLYLNRDDDAFSFMKYWTNLEFTAETEEILEQLHGNSKEGDWIYPKKDECRYLDFFQECNSTDRQSLDLSFLVAVCIIKMRIVAAYDAKTESVKKFSKTSGGDRICRVDDITGQVSEFVAGGNKIKTKVDDQRRQIEELMDQIHANNPSMLPSLINPTPLKSQPSPMFERRGQPSEAYNVLLDSHRCFLRVPGAQKLLEKRFGKNPTYDHEIGASFAEY